jgi:hypothetical protein
MKVLQSAKSKERGVWPFQANNNIRPDGNEVCDTGIVSPDEGRCFVLSQYSASTVFLVVMKSHSQASPDAPCAQRTRMVEPQDLKITLSGLLALLDDSLTRGSLGIPTESTLLHTAQ